MAYTCTALSGTLPDVAYLARPRVLFVQSRNGVGAPGVTQAEREATLKIPFVVPVTPDLTAPELGALDITYRPPAASAAGQRGRFQVKIPAVSDLESGIPKIALTCPRCTSPSDTLRYPAGIVFRVEGATFDVEADALIGLAAGDGELPCHGR